MQEIVEPLQADHREVANLLLLCASDQTRERVRRYLTDQGIAERRDVVLVTVKEIVGELVPNSPGELNRAAPFRQEFRPAAE